MGWICRRTARIQNRPILSSPILITHSHCTGQGPGNDGYCTHAIYTLCTIHTTQGQGTIAFYCVHPGPCPVPGALQCV